MEVASESSKKNMCIQTTTFYKLMIYCAVITECKNLGPSKKRAFLAF